MRIVLNLREKILRSSRVGTGFFGVALACLLVATSVGQTATSNVTFTGAVTNNNSCAINVLNNGTLGVQSNFRRLSSKIAGGAAAVADIVSTTNYYISAIANPGFVIAPAGGNTNTTFVARYRGQSIVNGRTFGERNGPSRVRLRTGNSTTRVSVHLIATRTGSNFPNGHYEGLVTIRCE